LYYWWLYFCIGYWKVSTFATGFNSPQGIANDNYGNIYVSDTNNGVIKKISPTGQVILFAGTGVKTYKDGLISEARFHSPGSLSVSKAGVFVIEQFKNSIRWIQFLWTPFAHHWYFFTIQKLIKTIMMLTLINPLTNTPKYQSCSFYKLPKDILYIIFQCMIAHSTNW